MLVAVHLSDGVLGPAWLIAGWCAAAAIVWRALDGITDEEISRTGVTAAAFFVGSQIHLPVGGVGSVHLLLNGVAGVLLGRRAPLALAVGLALQALLFGHGGPVTLGVNLTVYALPALAVGWAGKPRTFRAGALLGGGCALATVGLSGAVLAAGGVDGADRAAPAVLVMNLPLVAVEAVVTGFVAAYWAKAREPIQ